MTTHTGVLTQWNDQRGFGFVETQSGQRVFVHISAFANKQVRPARGDVLVFKVVQADGKTRATEAQLTKSMNPASPSKRSTTASFKFNKKLGRFMLTGGVWLVPAWFVLLVLLTLFGLAEVKLLWFYMGLSGLSFLVYLFDKSQAKKDSYRVSESNLHALALFGGWPGALLAQQLLRHKTVKREFRVTFWVTVALHTAVVLWLLFY